MPRIGDMIINLNGKEYFYKIVENEEYSQKKNIEYRNYETITEERNKTLKKYLEIKKKKNEYKDDIIDDLLNKLEIQIKNKDNSESDIFYEIIENNDNKSPLFKEIYEEIKSSKKYKIKEIIDAFEKIEFENIELENLDKKYLIKLYCFNFIAFNYRENELKEKNPSFNKKNYIQNIINKELNNCPVNALRKKEYKLKLLNDKPDLFSYIFLEKGIGLNNPDFLMELKKLRDENKKEKNTRRFQIALQHIMKQIQIGLFLFHHLSKFAFLYHKDLKIHNIFVMNYELNKEDNADKIYEKILNATFKIIDFDLTKKFDNHIIYNYDDPDKEEMFEIGEILWELITGESFYKIVDGKKILNNKLKREYYLCENIIDFLHQSLLLEEKYRINCDSGFIHPFISEDEKQFDNDKILNFDNINNYNLNYDKTEFLLPVSQPFFVLNPGNYDIVVHFSEEF